MSYSSIKKKTHKKVFRFKIPEVLTWEMYLSYYVHCRLLQTMHSISSKGYYSHHYINSEPKSNEIN